jgi:hypothetical protein
MPLDERGLSLLRNQTGKAALVSQQGMLPMGAARPQAFKVHSRSRATHTRCTDCHETGMEDEGGEDCSTQE